MSEGLRRYLVTTSTGLVHALLWVIVPKIDQTRCLPIGLGCRDLDLVVVPAALFLAALLTWGVLAVTGTRRAWLVALLLPVTVFTLVKTVFAEAGGLPSGPVAALFVVAVTLGYALAAVLSDDRLPAARRLAGAVPVAVLLVLAVTRS